MKKIKNYAHSIAGDSLIVELQTNGFFSEPVAKWIADNVNILWISCDGPAYIQNVQRPSASLSPTSSVVENNIKYLLKEKKSMQLGVRITLTPQTINKQVELVEYFNDLGIKFINALPTFASIDENFNDIFNWDPLEFAKNFLIAHNHAKKLGVWYNTMFIVNFDEKTRFACRACTPCPHLTTDGYVSCCDFAQLGPEYSPGPLQQLIYGKYDPSQDIIIYNEEKTSKVRSRCVENLLKNKCSDCAFVYNCAGGCLGQVVNETGDLLGRIDRNCTIVKYLAERMERNKKLHPALHS